MRQDQGVSERTACPICRTPALDAGAKRGALGDRTFRLRRCPACRFAFVADPRRDYDAIYGEDYYAGRGADPLVDYVFEAEHPGSTIRRYEWRGIGRAVSFLKPIGHATRWLDFGCGTGGLVRYAAEEFGCAADGFEEGWGKTQLEARGTPVLSRQELAERAGAYDVVTAIEVLEHVEDPVGELRTIASLLRPGGLLFLTTGNAAPHADDLARWPYVIPEIHISFFEPRSLARAMDEAGLEPGFPGRIPGWEDIIRFKVLKNLRRRSVLRAYDALPWGIAAAALDRRLGLSAHPVGWAPARR